MSPIIRCYTLFDITQTGVMNRYRAPEQHSADWLTKRNSQCNLDTLLQVISMRSQPIVIGHPEKVYAVADVFGEQGPVWVFDFEVQHASVFSDGKSELGALLSDCQGVPMLHILPAAAGYLDTNPSSRNIHFEVIH